MTKEKQIEEMAKAILYAGDTYDTCNKDDCETIASLIYNAGYRKASDVAREIFEEIDKHFLCGTTPLGLRIYSIGSATYIKLKNKYIGEDINVTTSEEDGK